jgi:bifunctional non-homologous end joining protein LigD
VVIDGEAVWCDDSGLAIFDKLHSRTHDDQVFLYAFDLLDLNGEDWRPRPLEERKARLAELLAKAPVGIQYSEHLEGDGAAISAHACKVGCEGIEAPRAPLPFGGQQGMAQDQEPGGACRAAVPGGAMTGAPDHLRRRAVCALHTACCPFS